MSEFKTPAEHNDRIAQNIIAHASRATYVLRDGDVNGLLHMPLKNTGLLSHLTIEGDYKRISRIRLSDLENRLRISCAPYILHRRRNVVLIPVSRVFFDGDDFLIKTLSGAIWLNVCSASCYLSLEGLSDKVIVKQYVFTNLPGDRFGAPYLPVTDLMQINTVQQ